MQRVTEAQLKAIVERINVLTNSPRESHTKNGEKYISNVGNYHLSYAYGGVSLHRMMNESGGVKNVFGCGYIPRRELANRMWAFIDSLDAKPIAA